MLVFDKIRPREIVYPTESATCTMITKREALIKLILLYFGIKVTNISFDVVIPASKIVIPPAKTENVSSTS